MTCKDVRQCYKQLEKDGQTAKTCKNSKCLSSYDNRKNVMVQENKKKYTLMNDGDEIAVYKVDGGMIDSYDEIKCDYLLLAMKHKKALFIELKGTDLRHGLEQVYETFQRLNRALDVFQLEGRIITSPRTNIPNMKTNPLYVKVKKAFCQRQGDLVVKANEYTDDLAKL